MLDQALEALKTFDWGTPLTVVAPIEDAIAAARDQSQRQQIEHRLLAALNEKISRDARGYICRKLAIVGSTASVETLLGLFILPANSHMARFALERIPDPRIAVQLCIALPQLKRDLRIGAINTLGARREATAASCMKQWLESDDAETARAAALALGAIGTAESVTILQSAVVKSPSAPVSDALLTCAEALLADQKVSEAKAIYEKLNDPQKPRLVRLAATRGLLACAAQQA